MANFLLAIRFKISPKSIQLMLELIGGELTTRTRRLAMKPRERWVRLLVNCIFLKAFRPLLTHHLSGTKMRKKLASAFDGIRNLHLRGDADRNESADDLDADALPTLEPTVEERLTPQHCQLSNVCVPCVFV